MKKLKITLENRNSSFFPVNAKWTINKVKYTSVFESAEKAINYFSCRYYGNITVIDKTN